MAKRRMMWMGPRGFERWVPASDARNDFSRIGNRQQDQYLNGGAGIRGTKESHREYNLTWTGRDVNDMLPVLDMAEGLYDGEDGELIYFIDPTTMERNVLPPNWAAPYKTAGDAVPFMNDGEGYPVYPTEATTATNALGYPRRSARYRVGPSYAPQKLYVPIPEGHVLWLGAHGVDENGCVAVAPVSGPLTFAQVKLPMLSVTSTDRVSTPFRSADGYTGVELSLAITDPSKATTGYATLSGIIGQILPEGTAPFPGNFISGRGNSGCEFAGYPTEMPYLNGRKSAFSVKLVETGAWR